MKNYKDNKCGLWCIARWMLGMDKCRGDITSQLREYAETFDITNVNFPMDYKDYILRKNNSQIPPIIVYRSDENKNIFHTTTLVNVENANEPKWSNDYIITLYKYIGVVNGKEVPHVITLENSNLLHTV